MRRRRVLGALATAVPVALAGCTGSRAGGDPDATTTSTEPTSTTRTTTTTRDACSRDLAVDVSVEKPDDVELSARAVVSQVEPPVAAAHFDPDGGFSSFRVDTTTQSADTGVRVEGTADAHFEKTGDGPNATTAHVHLRYAFSYHLTSRRVVRETAEEGPTGTVVCW